MKKQLRKYLSVERRDLWDNPKEYNFWCVSSDKLKYMLKSKSKKDRRLKGEIMSVLKRRRHVIEK